MEEEYALCTKKPLIPSKYNGAQVPILTLELLLLNTKENSYPTTHLYDKLDNTEIIEK